MDKVTFALTALIALGFGGMLFGLFMLERNGWVFRQRIALNKRHFDEVRERLRPVHPLWTEDYLSYNQMMWRFWIWDVEKMKK